MTSNLKQRTEKLKAENQRYRNTKNQNTERPKTYIYQKNSKKVQTKQNNDHPQIMRKIQFRSSFNGTNKLKPVSTGNQQHDKKRNRREIKIKAKTKAFDFHAVFKIMDQ